MEKMTIDCGVRQYKINGKGVLRFKPKDPNVYARFGQLLEQLPQGENLPQLDKKLKEGLTQVFPGNDFEALLGGVSLLAVGANGERVLTNFLHCLEPILRRGALDAARAQAEAL